MGNRRGVAADDTAVVFQTGLHPASCLGAAGLAAFVMFVGTLIVRHNDLPAATDLRVIAGSAVLAVLALAGPLRRLGQGVLVVTPRWLSVRLGAWRTRAVTIPLDEIRSVDVRSSPLGRQLNFGTVTVGVADEEFLVVPHVRAPMALKEALRRGGGRR